jgi:hypothetical protein
MKKVLITVLTMVMLTGCATWGKVCEQGPAIKARIRSALQIAQIGYPLVASLAGQTANPDILGKVALVDAALDVLGKLSYDLTCPSVAELNMAQTALEKAQGAKAELGLK